MLVATPLLLELLLLLALGVLLAESERSAKRVDYYRRLMSSTTKLQKQLLDASSLITFYSMNKKQIMLDSFNQAYASTVKTLSDLTDAGDRDKKHKRAIMKVCAIGNEAIELLDQTRLSATDSAWIGKMSITRLPDQLLQITSDYMNVANELAMELEKTEKISPKEAEKAMVLQYACIAMAVLVAVIFIILSLLFYKQLTDKLVILMDNTKRFADGEDLHPVLAGEDEVSKLDQIFHQMSESIKESNEFRAQIIATVSHEIRTPLTALSNFLTLLGMGSYGQLSEDASSRSQLAEKQVSRLIRLLNDLLAAESLRAKGFNIVLKKIDLSDIGQQAVAAVSHLAAAKKLTLANELSSLELEADGDRILQVLINLLSNAIKFSDEGEKIIVRAELSPKEVTIMVIDRGRGVPPELQEAIFERHVQVKESDKTQKGGAGLGLAICKAIVLQHGGHIGSKNNEDKGSTFWFSLPLPK